MLTIFADFGKKINGRGEEYRFFPQYDAMHEVIYERKDL